MDFITLLGFAAGACTTVAFLPQVIRTWKTKSSEDLSFATFGLFLAGVCLWLVYGIVRSDPSIIAANVVTLVLASVLIGLMIRYRLRDRRSS